MARTYTPGLKVLNFTKIQRTRQLPMRGDVHLKVGDDVEPDTKVASTHIPGNVQMLNVANTLNVEAKEVPELMKVTVDENISKSQVLAETKGFFGLFKSQAKSPIDGTVSNISDVTGQVILSEPPIPIEVDAYISGAVSKVIPEEGLVVETKCAMIQGILGIGGESRGDIAVLASNPEDELTAAQINDTHKGKVIVGGSYLNLEAFQKALQVGVAGIISGGFDYSNINDVLGYTLGVAITGQEDLTTTLILTEGMGKIKMAQRTFDLLKSHEGRFCAINGTTQIRAGVLRPEIIIPLLSKDEKASNVDEKDLAIVEGSTIRVIRAPYFGQTGKIVKLPHQLQKMESETMVRVAEVEFKDGSKSTIPRANLEMIVSD